MRIVPPAAYPADDGSYRDLSGLVSGSRIPAEIFNAINGEIPGFIAASGLTPSQSDLAQLTKASRSQRVNWVGAFGGTANALTCGPSPAFTSLSDLVGVPIRGKINSTNTGAVTLTVNGLPPVAVTWAGSVVLRAGEAIAGDLVTFIYDGATFLYATTSNNASAAPSGQVAFFAMQSAPTGWLKANGAAISRTSYAELFAAIGTTFGGGNGSTTFNIPDLRGEFIRGWDDGRGADASRAFGSFQLATKIPDYGGFNSSTPWAINVAVDQDHQGEFANLWGVAMSTQQTAGPGSWLRFVRPRNVALLPCIKF